MLAFLLSLVFANQNISIERIAYSSKKDPANAKQEILNKVIKQVSLEYIEKIIGKEQASTKAKGIEFKVLPQYGKYIPYLKQGNLQGYNPYSMQVQMNFSQQALKDLLLQEGILNFSAKDIRILPFVSFLDKKHSKAYKWWFQDNNLSETLVFEQAIGFQGLFRDYFWKEGFDVLDPMRGDYYKFIPSGFNSITYSTEDLQSLGKALGAQIIAFGHLHIGPNPRNSMSVKLEADLEAMLVASDRKIAVTKKSFETPAGNYEQNIVKYGKEFYLDTLKQFQSSLKDSWQKGLFDTKRVKILVNANLDYKSYQEIKQKLTEQSLRIKNLMDRSFKPDQIIFEADVSAGAQALAEDLKNLQFQGKKVSVSALGEHEISIDL